jgi:hypothetical protein
MVYNHMIREDLDLFIFFLVFITFILSHGICFVDTFIFLYQRVLTFFILSGVHLHYYKKGGYIFLCIHEFFFTM